MENLRVPPEKITGIETFAGIPVAFPFFRGMQFLINVVSVHNPTTAGRIGWIYDTPLTNKVLSSIEKAGRKSQHEWHFNVQEQEKQAVFRRLADYLDANRGLLARTMTLESGKLWRWAEAEVQETIDTLNHYWGEISRYHTPEGMKRCQMPDKNAYSVRHPFGLILGITPWNFPLAVPFWKICGALAGGNSIVVKDAEQTPFTLTIARELFAKTLFDVLGDKRAPKLTDLIQIVHGRGETTGKTLAEKLNYDKVAFTGSAEVGKLISFTAGRRLKPHHLELGGHAGMIVLDDFNIDRAVDEAITANLGDSGQRCTSLRAALVQETKYEEFVERYLEKARVRKMGDPMKFDTEMGPLVSEEQLRRITDQVERTERELGREAHFGGRPCTMNNPRLTNGYFFAPTVFLNAPYGTTVMDEEIFGPVLAITSLPGKNREEAFWNGVRLINQSRQGLSNCLLTRDHHLVNQAIWHINSGLLYIGRGPTGAEVGNYFSVIKDSGWGHEAKGLDEWTHIMQVFDDYAPRARMAQTGAEETTKEIIANSKSPLEIPVQLSL